MFPSTVVCHDTFVPEIRYKLFPPVSPIAKNLLLLANIGDVILISFSELISPELLYVYKIFLFKIQGIIRS